MPTLPGPRKVNDPFSPVPIRFVLPCLSTWMPPTKNLSAKKYLFVERQRPVFS
jgi:hypothetical protein